MVGCLLEPVFVAGEEACAEFLQANDVGIGSVDELYELFSLFFFTHVSDVVGYDGDGAIGICVVLVRAEVQWAIVEDEASDEECSYQGNPYESWVEEQPEDDEEQVDDKEDGEGECQE